MGTCVCFSPPVEDSLSPLSQRVCWGVDLGLRRPSIAMVTPSGRRLWHSSLPCPHLPTGGSSGWRGHKSQVSFSYIVKYHKSVQPLQSVKHTTISGTPLMGGNNGRRKTHSITWRNELTPSHSFVNSCLSSGACDLVMVCSILTESASSTSHRSSPVAGLYTGIFLPLQDSCHSLLMNSCHIRWEIEKNNPHRNRLLKDIFSSSGISPARCLRADQSPQHMVQSISSSQPVFSGSHFACFDIFYEMHLHSVKLEQYSQVIYLQ